MRLYSSEVPLRTTAAWPGFREAVVLPHRYGATAGGLVQYSSDRRTFCWADHPCQSIDAVYVDEQQVYNWTWRNAADAAGQVVCFVEFTEAPKESAALEAHGRAKVSSVTGLLIDSPADVLHDLLANIGGKSITRAQLDPFRRACERANLSVAGSFADAEQTLQGAAREICASVGALFSPDAVGLAFLHPGGETGPALETVDLRFEFTATASLDALCNDLTLQFDYVDGRPRQAIQMECTSSVAAVGRRPRSVAAPWLTSGRVAASVATRMLQRAARPIWRAEADGVKRPLRIGDHVAMAHPLLPITGAFPILSRTTRVQQGTSRISFEMPAGPVPSVALVRLSARLARQQATDIAIEQVGDDYEFQFVDPDSNAPLAQAQVTLNGATTRQADGAGVVRFPASLLTRGKTHRFDVATLDGRTLMFQVPIP